MKHFVVAGTIVVAASLTSALLHAQHSEHASTPGAVAGRKTSQAPDRQDRLSAPCQSSSALPNDSLDWRVYMPCGGVQEPSGPVDLKVVILLTENKTAAKRITVDSLSKYIENVRSVVTKQFGNKSDEAFDLMITCELLPNNSAKLEIATRPEANHEELQRLYDELKKVVVPEVRKGSVRFQAVFTVNGGSGELEASSG